MMFLVAWYGVRQQAIRWMSLEVAHETLNRKV